MELRTEATLREYVVTCPACKLTATMQFEARGQFIVPVADHRFRVVVHGSRSVLVHVGCGVGCTIMRGG